MLSNNNEKQKSPKRRFLLILGAVTFSIFIAMGLMFIFWDGFFPKLVKPQRTIFGAVVILYSVLRFSRYLRKDPNDE
jgi:peptidoglycan/LPS O-acetylase OafA/YrhL